MSLRMNTLKRTNAADELAADLSVLDIYTGSQPASANTAASGTLLASITGIVWGAAAAGVVSVTGTPSEDAVASGTAGWGRFRNAGDTVRIDGAVGSEFTLADPDIVSGGTVTLTGAQITMPSGE